MTYQTDRDALTRQSLNIVELDLDTKITDGGKEYLSDGTQPHGQMFWPCVNSIKWVPTRASATGGLGYFGEVVVTCTDFNWPGGNGTYFGRLLANNDYYLNRAIKIHVGFFKRGDTFSFSNFEERRYFIKKITGPDSKGKVQIFGTDVLSQLKESQAPKATYGNLAGSLTDSATGSTDIGDNTNFSASGGYAIINDEIVAYSGVTGGDSITISSRGQGGTTAAAHSAGDAVRDVYQNNGNVVDIIRDLIENYTEIDHATYLPDADWNTERDDPLASETFDCWVKEPKSVDKIIHDLGAQAYTGIWWDDAAQEIKLKAIRTNVIPASEWTDAANILDTKVTFKRDQRTIVTQVWVYYNKINQAKGNDAENFTDLYVYIDSAAETGLGQPNIKKVFGEYIAALASASKIASRIVKQNSKPIELSLHVDAKDSDVEVSDVIDLSTDLYQDTNGDPLPIKLRVIEKALDKQNRYKYKMIYSGITPGNRYGYIAPNSVADYDSATQDERNKYAFIADGSDKVGAADDLPYLIE